FDANPREEKWESGFSPPDFDDLRPGLQRFTDVAAFFFQPAQSGVNLRGAGEPARLPAAYVSDRFFPTFGVGAAVGRTFLPEENVEGRDGVAMISHRLWQSRFGGDRSVVGRTLSFDDRPFQVVGVMPPRFAFPAPQVDVWLPISVIGENDIPTFRALRWMDVVARLAPGATPAGAQAELDRKLTSLAAQYPDSNAGWERAVVEPLQVNLVGDVRPVLRVLFTAVGLVLVIACANLVNLLLARGTARTQELAVRGALGAQRSRLVRQLLTEGLALALLGGALGLALALWGVRLLVVLAGDHLPRAAEIHPDARLVGFTLVVSLLAAFLFGLLPSLRWSRTAGSTALREGGRAVGGGERERLRGALVVAETALAVLLLVGAGLLTKGLWRLTHVDPGFRPERVLSLGVTFPSDLPGGAEELASRRDAVLARLRALPGVEAVGGSKTLPLHGQGEPYGFALPANPAQEITPSGGGFIVTPGYFRALGVPVLRGREYGPEDRRDGPLTLVVNAALAKQLWGTTDAVGKTVLWRDRPLTIVGVVGDVRTAGLGQPAPPAIYVGTHLAARSSLKLFVRTASDPAAMADAVRAAIHEVEPDLPVTDMAPLDRVVSGTLVQPRLFATLLGLFSGMALVLTLVGLYGVISFAVAQRTREIAVRMALGAPRRQVLGMVLRRVAGLSGAGLVLGLAAAVVLARVLAGRLFGVSAHDPATFASVAALLALAALAAGYVPARRAARVAPASSLRGD
ncbi:MAG TPA: ABC transporter permease, partial [Thermoanaerobaculia bacterium]|nr:ABC transporter permease [Thermoanaerobaculia bacterium]